MSQLLLRVRLKATESLFWFSCTCENTLLHILPWRIQVSFHTHKSWKIAVLTLGRNYFIRFYCTTLFNCRLRLLWEKPPYTCIQTRLISPLVNSTWISAWWPIMCRPWLQKALEQLHHKQYTAVGGHGHVWMCNEHMWMIDHGALLHIGWQNKVNPLSKKSSFSPHPPSKVVWVGLSLSGLYTDCQTPHLPNVQEPCLHVLFLFYFLIIWHQSASMWHQHWRK